MHPGIKLTFPVPGRCLFFQFPVKFKAKSRFQIVFRPFCRLPINPINTLIWQGITPWNNQIERVSVCEHCEEGCVNWMLSGTMRPMRSQQMPAALTQRHLTRVLSAVPFFVCVGNWRSNANSLLEVRMLIFVHSPVHTLCTFLYCWYSCYWLLVQTG